MKCNNSLLVGSAIVLLLLGPICVLADSFGPSFDCNEARTSIEKAICADAELSDLDDRLGEVYKDMKRWAFIAEDSEKEAFMREQREWIRQRNTESKGLSLQETGACLRPLYETRVADLEGRMEKVWATRKKRRAERFEYFKTINPGPEATPDERYKAAVAMLKKYGHPIDDDLRSCFENCEEIKQAFLSGDGIEIVQPIKKFDIYDEDIMHPYRDKCPELDFITIKSAPARFVDELVQEHARDEEWGRLGQLFKGVRDFRIYHLAPEDKNKEFYAFYAGKWSGTCHGSPCEIKGAFDFYNLNSCRRISYDPVRGPEGPKEFSLHGIFKYKNKYYVFQVYGYVLFKLHIKRHSHVDANVILDEMYK